MFTPVPFATMSSMIFILGSTSQLKLNITTRVIVSLMGTGTTITGCDVDSNVPEAPWNEQSLIGARNRAIAGRQQNKNADYCIGIESGLVERWGTAYEEAWAAINDKTGNIYTAYSSGLAIPKPVLDIMQQQGLTHDQAIKQIELKLKSSDLKNRDTWHTYSGGQISRDISIEEAVRNALIQILENEASLYIPRA